MTAYLAARVSREGSWYVSECLGLPVTSQGESQAEAMAGLIEAVYLFLDTCQQRGTLGAVLLKSGWRLTLAPPTDMPKGAFALPVPLSALIAKQALELPV